MSRLRKYIVAGLLVWLPILATYFIVRFLIEGVDNVVKLIPEQYRPDQFFGMHIPGIGLVITIVIVFITGIIATNFFGKKLFELSEKLLHRIPLVRSIYSAARQLVHTLLTPNGNSFKKAVMIEFPRKGVYSIGFVTNNGFVSPNTDHNSITVFVPTAPNPTSGFMMIVPQDQVTELDISVEQAFKMVVSIGVIAPDHVHLKEIS